MEAYYGGTFRTKLLPLPSRAAVEASLAVASSPPAEASAVIDRTSELLEALQRIADLEARLDAKSRQATQDAAKLLSQVDINRNTLERLEEQNRGLAEDYRNCRQQLQQSDEKNRDLEQQLRHLDEACVALQHKFQRATTRIMELVAQVKSTEERLEVQRQINVGLEDQLVALTNSASNALHNRQTEQLSGTDREIPAANLDSSIDSDNRQTSRSAAAAVAARISSIEDDVRNFYAHFPSSAAAPAQVAPATAPLLSSSTGRTSQQAQMRPQAQQVQSLPQQHQNRKTDLNYVVVDQLDSDLVAKCKYRDEIEAKYRKLENAKIRTVAEKARKDSLEHELSVLNHDISDIRSQLRGMDQLFK